MNRFLPILLVSLFFSCHSHAQLITTISSPANAVQNVLLGAGVTVSNISYQGAGTTIGSFTANSTNLGIASGVVITTGTIINNGSGPQGPNNVENSGVDNGTPGYGVLTNMVGTTTYDASILEFDFVPYSDTVRFKYVFGSEEFLEYCGTQFNDVFGFFISGPGIVPDPATAPYKNIAKIPGSNVNVAINNVHSFVASNISGNSVPAINPAYYVNNAGGSTIQYDGFTVPLEAVSQVQCGKTYHLIIAIADVGDGIYDSGIFLEANSLSSKTPVSIDHQISYDAFNNPDIMAEGCVSATYTLTRETNINQSLTIPINLSGSAIENVDYSNIPNSITFPPGQSQITFTFNALQDNLTEGMENILFEFVLTDPCGNLTPIFSELFIQDVLPISVTVNDTAVICAGNQVTLIPTITGGVGPYTYLWNTGATTETISVSPPATQSYTITVTDNCLNGIGTATGSGTVTVPIYPPISIAVSNDIIEICPYIPATLDALATGGTGVFNYQWTSSTGETLGQSASQNVLPSQTTTYTVTATDQCGTSSQNSVLYTITSPPLIVTISPGLEICPGDSVLITTQVIGGYGDYFYLWPHSGETTSSVWVNPFVTSSFKVIVSDECQTFTVEAITTITVVKPIADFTVSSHTVFDDLPITFQNLTLNGNTYQWDFGDGQNSTLVHPNNTYDDPGIYYVTLIATDLKGCKDTIIKPVTIIEAHYIYVPNTFTPDNNRYNNTFEASVYGIDRLDVQIFNRWGQLVFESSNPRFQWDGTYKGILCQDGTYTWTISYVANSGFEEKLVGHVNLVK